jgi:hypothetical protein
VSESALPWTRTDGREVWLAKNDELVSDCHSLDSRLPKTFIGCVARYDLRLKLYNQSGLSEAYDRANWHMVAEISVLLMHIRQGARGACNMADPCRPLLRSCRGQLLSSRSFQVDKSYEMNPIEEWCTAPAISNEPMWPACARCRTFAARR